MKWRTAVDRAVRPIGLTHAQYSLLASLYALSRTGVAPSQRELADFSGLEPVYVSKLAQQLARAELVERHDNPADPRAFSLRLTDHGEQTVQKGIRIVARLLDQLTQPIGGPHSDRGRQLVDTLRTLLREDDHS